MPRQQMKKLAIHRCTQQGTKITLPLPKLDLYPGMFVLLRTNSCPCLGLSKGSIGYVFAVLRGEFEPNESESSDVHATKIYRQKNEFIRNLPNTQPVKTVAILPL